MDLHRLSKRKQMFIELMSRANGDAPEEQAKKIGIRLETYMRWKKDPALLRTAYHEYRKDIIPRLPSVFSALIKKAEEGDINAIKIVFQQLESFNEPPSQSQEITPDEIIRIIQEEQQKKS